ncbi:RusA family crossover junction endodeoxyribonuclease [Methylophilales phage MEP301]|jgi:crossover junction endodeoxyribonuclease RusA|nr:RusA family crossover junction endodeoxyribonuclease [Methylophilales phage MEP301]
MNPTIRLELPYPPSVNSYWRANGHRRYISKEGVEFTKAVDLVVKQSNAKSFEEKKVAVSVMIHPRSKRKFDLDNTLKAILDALMKAGMYNDDSQIEYIEIARGEAVDGGKAVVHLYDYIGEEHG